MAITAKEFISVVKNFAEFFSENPGFVFKNDEEINVVDELRKLYKSIRHEYAGYEVYPRYDTTRLKDSIEKTKELCDACKIKLTGIIVFAQFEPQNWSELNSINELASFEWEGVKINKLIEF